MYDEDNFSLEKHVKKAQYLENFKTKFEPLKINI